MQGCDPVIHAAAKVEIWGEYSSFVEPTVEGTRNVVEAARAAGVPKFVHVGTEAVSVKVGFSGFYFPMKIGCGVGRIRNTYRGRFLPQASAVLRPRRHLALLLPPLFVSKYMEVSMHMEAGFV